jgi:hypothetical protein
MKSIVLKIYFYTLIVLSLLACTNDSTPSFKNKEKTSAVVKVVEKKEDTIWITAVGDVVPASDYDRIALPPEDGKYLIIDDLLPHIQNSDLAFANFEGVLTGCECEARKCNDRRFCYRFRIPEVYANRVKDAGFDFLNIACNHIEDFGKAGREYTNKRLREIGFYTAGIEGSPCISFEKNGKKYGFCAFAQFQGCAKIRDSLAMISEVKKMVSENDIVIVSLHGGAEGPAHRHIPKTDEIFLEFNRGNMYNSAHLCIDAGADLVIGTGPHVTRAIELYKNKLIMYSLGNFCTYGPFGNHVYTRHAPLMKIGIDAQGNFLEGNAIPIKQIDKGMPRYDSTGLAIKHLKELTESDFPATELKIQDDGKIIKFKK